MTVGQGSGSAICYLPGGQLFPGHTGESGMRRSVTECGLCFVTIPETDSQILGLSELPLSLTYTGHSWPQASTLKTVDLSFLSLQCHLKKEKKPNAISPPSLRPPSISCSPSPLPHSIPERQTGPDNICSSQHRLISLHTSSERMLSRGVWDISPLRRTGSGTSATNTEVSPWVL